jgi:integrase
MFLNGCKKEKKEKMANKTTVALTQKQYQTIINKIKTGGNGYRPNNRIATALVLEANLGIRIEDILNLRLTDIIKDGNRYRLNITEQKTSKKRTFTVPIEIYDYIKEYAKDNNIDSSELLFSITERAVQKHLAKVAADLGYQNIGTHSFRKFFATEIYLNNDYNIVLVQQLLQHSSVAITQKYVGISSEMQEKALAEHVNLL